MGLGDAGCGDMGMVVVFWFATLYIYIPGNKSGNPSLQTNQPANQPLTLHLHRIDKCGAMHGKKQNTPCHF